MPILPENKARYPKDWKAISAAVRTPTADAGALLAALQEIQTVAHADREDWEATTVESLCRWLRSVVDPVLAQGGNDGR